MLDYIKAINENEVQNVSGGAYNGPCFLYLTKAGDTISRLAQCYNTTVEILCALNSDLSRYNPNLPLPDSLRLLIPCLR